MNEPEVMTLISEGENESLDFKRKLNLESKIDKGEFVKDVISIANSASSNKGYIFIGVEDNKSVVGTDQIEEERIQQIIHSYIRPIVNIRCFPIRINPQNPILIGVIEIVGTNRPYHVARPIGNLGQDDVFVRHGSVVTKATFEELERMRKETQLRQEAQKFVNTAEIHMRLSNFKEAINAYSKAIEVGPTAELFYARGIAYKAYAVSVKKSEKFSNELLNRAVKDFLDTIQLAETIEQEKSARLERFRIFEIDLLDYDGWIEDLEWLKKNTDGDELGEVIYLDCKAGEDRVGITNLEPDNILKELNHAIELGYKKPEIYKLRAHAHYFLHNYGLALNDINMALDGLKDETIVENALCLKANIEALIGQFKEAYESFEKARNLTSGLNFQDGWGYIRDDADNALWKYCLVQEFEGRNNKVLQAVFQALLVNMISKEVTRIAMRGNKVVAVSPSIAGKASIEEEYPHLVPIIIEMVGEEFWEKCDIIAQSKSLVWNAD